MIFEVKTLLGRKTRCTLVHFFGSLGELILFKTRSMFEFALTDISSKFCLYYMYHLRFSRVLYVSFGKIMMIYSELLGALKRPYIRATEKGNRSAPIVHDVRPV